MVFALILDVARITFQILCFSLVDQGFHIYFNYVCTNVINFVLCMLFVIVIVYQHTIMYYTILQSLIG